MKNTNERVTLAARLQERAAQVVSEVLIRQADKGTRSSGFYFVSEPAIPIELLKEDAK